MPIDDHDRPVGVDELVFLKEMLFRGMACDWNVVLLVSHPLYQIA